jgi:XTP/dITP diphosphohydrolase
VATSPPWVLATRSSGKLEELRALFAGEGIAVVDLNQAGIPESSDEEGLECHRSFEENALAKARHFHRLAGGRVVVADDSGLEVIALGNEPGVRSRRWSGRTDLGGAALDEANNALLVERLRHACDRRARFVCAAAWCSGSRAVVAVGEVAGTIVDTPEGENGFGYDPYFHAPELGTTMAAASVVEKQEVSHRGRAVRALLARLRADGTL